MLIDTVNKQVTYHSSIYKATAHSWSLAGVPRSHMELDVEWYVD